MHVKIQRNKYINADSNLHEYCRMFVIDMEMSPIQTFPGPSPVCTHLSHTRAPIKILLIERWSNAGYFI